MKQQEYPARDNSCGLARTLNLAVWMEHPTAECGTATGGSRPTAANGKFPQRSEDKKPNAFRRWVVHYDESLENIKKAVKELGWDYEPTDRTSLGCLYLIICWGRE